MTTVYAVSSGSYSDYSIHRIFSNIEAAEQFATDMNEGDRYERASVEEWKLEDVAPTKTIVYGVYLRWDELGLSNSEWDNSRVTFLDEGSQPNLCDGQVFKQNHSKRDGGKPDKKGNYTNKYTCIQVHSMSTDKQWAFQAARDKMAQLRAEVEGIV